MAIIYYDAEDFCNVSQASFPLTISVKIGDGQGGGYLIFNGIDLISTNAPGTIHSINEADQWVTVAVTVKDKLLETNWTSMTVYLQNANQEERIKFGPYKKEVPQHLDTVCYTLQLKLNKLEL
ncbi:hypothetical protein [Flavobacterium rhizosphaerae]|uniref:Uncharacterized protein n=1 Tax=Flavobacterium rhizosphaerae TaxID=3163298 RepID=A0ABW8YVW7_9FLAO